MNKQTNERPCPEKRKTYVLKYYSGVKTHSLDMGLYSGAMAGSMSSISSRSSFNECKMGLGGWNCGSEGASDAGVDDVADFAAAKFLRVEEEESSVSSGDRNNSKVVDGAFFFFHFYCFNFCRCSTYFTQS